MARSDCVECRHFSCEKMPQPDIRFRYVKDEGGAITNRIALNGVVYESGQIKNSIENCETRGLDSKNVGDTIKKEIGIKKKERKKKPKKKKGQWKNLR